MCHCKCSPCKCESRDNKTQSKNPGNNQRQDPRQDQRQDQSKKPGQPSFTNNKERK